MHLAWQCQFLLWFMAIWRPKINLWTFFTTEKDKSKRRRRLLGTFYQNWTSHSWKNTFGREKMSFIIFCRTIHTGSKVLYLKCCRIVSDVGKEKLWKNIQHLKKRILQYHPSMIYCIIVYKTIIMIQHLTKKRWKNVKLPDDSFCSDRGLTSIHKSNFGEGCLTLADWPIW